ncbi:MAG TPA: hypothetical protein VFV99_24315 [Kofleriaceae bacterium]|nr:hypothetical protein [Kofleriaceae bacterium]
MGWQHVADDDAEPFTQRVPCLSVGVGGWMAPAAAITLRLSAISSDPPHSSGLVVQALLGPALQLWPSDSIWLGAGVGLAFLRKTNDTDTAASVGFEARAGYTFNRHGKHSINASIEMLTARFTNDDSSLHFTGRMTSVGVLLGYQLL